jgi:hypothetical protein
LKTGDSEPNMAAGKTGYKSKNAVTWNLRLAKQPLAKYCCTVRYNNRFRVNNET